jgi:hypothetical protein
MPIVYTQESEYAKELAKWEQWPTLLAPTPGRPYQPRPFPQMLYKAVRLPNGQPGCFLPMTSVHDEQAEAFAKRCQLTVENESQAREAYKDGWRATVADALEAYEQQQQAIGDAAAEVAAAAQRMSARAQDELRAADAATADHVTDIQPRKKPRGRPRKDLPILPGKSGREE